MKVMFDPFGGLDAALDVTRALGNLDGALDATRTLGNLDATLDATRTLRGLDATLDVDQLFPVNTLRDVLTDTASTATLVGNLDATLDATRTLRGLDATLDVARTLRGLGATLDVDQLFPVNTLPDVLTDTASTATLVGNLDATLDATRTLRGLDASLDVARTLRGLDATLDVARTLRGLDASRLDLVGDGHARTPTTSPPLGFQGDTNEQGLWVPDQSGFARLPIDLLHAIWERRGTVAGLGGATTAWWVLLNVGELFDVVGRWVVAYVLSQWLLEKGQGRDR